MRIIVLAILLLPSAAAASEVHVTHTGSAYAVTFVSANDTAVVTWEGGETTAERVDPAGGEKILRASLPFDARRYTIEGESFDIAAPPGVADATRIAFVGDMGTDFGAKAVWAAIERADPDLVLVGGDLAYAHGNASIWSAWFEMVSPLASRVPVMPAFGNHEALCEAANGSLHHCGAAKNGWREHFALPNGDALFYAFEWGPARIVVLDSESYSGEPGEHTKDRAAQADLLRTALDVDDARFDIVAFHRPLRSTLDRPGSDSPGALAAWEPILDASSADLVLQAHVHAYERSWPLRKGAPVARVNASAEGNGIFYATSGGGGRDLYDTWGPAAPWLARRASEHHFLLIEASPDALIVKAIRVNGTRLDTFVIEADAAPPVPSSTPIATRPTSHAMPRAESAIPAIEPILATLAAVLTAFARRRARRVRG